jgi:predicted acylesterase/phospholipase RssA
VLVLQGGGALGSYQGGVYEALAAERLEPKWVTGISIGAINAALIAGNPPERRVERLRAFWELISSSSGVTPEAPKQGWARGVQRRERQLDRCFRSARVLQAAPRDDPPRSARNARSAEPLRHVAVEEDAGGNDRFRPRQQQRRDVSERRRGRHRQGQYRRVRQ